MSYLLVLTRGLRLTSHTSRQLQQLYEGDKGYTWPSKKKSTSVISIWTWTPRLIIIFCVFKTFLLLRTSCHHRRGYWGSSGFPATPLASPSTTEYFDLLQWFINSRWWITSHIVMWSRLIILSFALIACHYCTLCGDQRQLERKRFWKLNHGATTDILVGPRSFEDAKPWTQHDWTTCGHKPVVMLIQLYCPTVPKSVWQQW